MFNKKVFGERLSCLRTAVGASQQALGAEISVGKSAVSMMESGQRAASPEILMALASYFKVTVDYLLGATDIPDIPETHVYPQFPDRLKQLRLAKRLNIFDMAELLGTTERNYAGYEEGEMMPKLTVLCALADYFDVSLDYLVGRSDKLGRR